MQKIYIIGDYMRKTVLSSILAKKLSNNRPVIAFVRISVILIIGYVLGKITPYEFFVINKWDYFYKMANRENVSLLELFYKIWNSNIRLISINLFIIVVIIILLFRFRFAKCENFRLSRHTAIIAVICFVMCIIGFSYLVQYDILHEGLTLQERIIDDVLHTIFTVVVFEELIYRGFITNELFRLKPSGLKAPAAIAISAAIFGFVHIQGGIINALFGIGAFSISDAAREFFGVSVFGVSWSTILYYKKDIISSICIHAANNILFDSYRYSSFSMFTGALYVMFYILFIICYPAFLIYKERKKTKALCAAK